MSFLETDRDLSRQSYYVATAPRTQSFPALEETIDADVAVVGGGLAGMCAALELAERGLSVVLLGASGDLTATIDQVDLNGSRLVPAHALAGVVRKDGTCRSD